MSNRSAISVAALFASILAGAGLTSVTDNRAQAATDSCLTAPKEKTPAGSHWYYRLERGTKRQCWYLRGENDKNARAASVDESADDAKEQAAAEPSPAPQRPVRKSIANAHAELTVPQQRIEQDAPDARTVGVAPAAPPQSAPAASLVDSATPSSALATRWPDSSEVMPPATFRTAAAEPQAAPQDSSQAAPSAEAAPVTLTTADSPMSKQSGSIQMLLIVVLGALALAGFTTSLILKVGGARARKRQIELRIRNPPATTSPF